MHRDTGRNEYFLMNIPEFLINLLGDWSRLLRGLDATALNRYWQI